MLAQNVRVLGVDQSDNDEADKPAVAKSVTVEVTPEQAQSISLGQQVGTVSLALRHVADDATLTEKPMTVVRSGPCPAPDRRQRPQRAGGARQSKPRNFPLPSAARSRAPPRLCQRGYAHHEQPDETY